MRAILKTLLLFAVGGAVYTVMELAFRGRTHWTMFLVGGICFVLVGGLNNWFSWEMSVLCQMAVSAVAITGIEFFAGLILNVWLGLGVWDYSNMPLNIMGQICLPFTLLWFLLSFVAIVLDDYLRWRWFGEKFPEYHLTGRGGSGNG